MIEGKAFHGKTNAELAKDFNVSLATVERTLSWAARADLFSTYEDKIVTELLPLAHDAISAALAEGNAKIAVQVLKGIGLLRTGGQATSKVQAQSDDDLASYIAKKRDLAQLRESIIDTELIEEETTDETETQSRLPQGAIQFLGPVDSPVATSPDESGGSEDPISEISRGEEH